LTDQLMKGPGAVPLESHVRWLIDDNAFALDAHAHHRGAEVDADLSRQHQPRTSLVQAMPGRRLRIEPNALDSSAHRRQLAHHVLVTALNMPRIEQNAFALGA